MIKIIITRIADHGLEYTLDAGPHDQGQGQYDPAVTGTPDQSGELGIPLQVRYTLQPLQILEIPLGAIQVQTTRAELARYIHDIRSALIDLYLTISRSIPEAIRAQEAEAANE